jgi:LytS/YehU family sensor histidine kinase
LNPHFLFNSLNAVSTLVVEGDAVSAARMLSQISEFLRDTLETEMQPEVPLSREVLLAGRYLAIEQTRLGDRLRVRLDIDPNTRDALVPGLLLQPLVENAVRHGVAALIEGGDITIRTERHGPRLQVSIGNSGPAVGEAGRAVARGIGLTNTAERLRTLYGADHTFLLLRLDSGGYEATLNLPFRTCLGETGAPALCVC